MSARNQLDINFNYNAVKLTFINNRKIASFVKICVHAPLIRHPIRLAVDVEQTSTISKPRLWLHINIPHSQQLFLISYIQLSLPIRHFYRNLKKELFFSSFHSLLVISQGAVKWKSNFKIQFYSVNFFLHFIC